MKNNKKFRIKLKSKHLLAIMTFFCLAAIVATFASGRGPTELQNAASRVVIPFQKSMTSMGAFLRNIRDNFRDKQALLMENEELKVQLESLISENNKLIQDQQELARLEALYDLQQEYNNLPTVAARIISKDPGNWYDTFIINKGERDGIRVDNNVIAGRGLVGIVTQTGPTWATVRAIIDDASHISAMTVSTNDFLTVEGDLELIDEGKLYFEQLYDQDNRVTVGERVVTSSISEKYVEGLFIGYISDIVQDTNNLTKAGNIVTPIDFRHLRDVLVITRNKQDYLDPDAAAAYVSFVAEPEP